jgi:hypothetical protein
MRQAQGHEDGWRRLLTVEDRFELRSIGLVLAPEPELHAVVGGRGEAELRRPDGSRALVDLELLYVSRSDPARSAVDGAPAGLSAADVPLGTEVWLPAARFPSGA